MAENLKLRDLPAVHEVLERIFPALARFPRALVVNEKLILDLRAVFPEEKEELAAALRKL